MFILRTVSPPSGTGASVILASEAAEGKEKWGVKHTPMGSAGARAYNGDLGAEPPAGGPGAEPPLGGQAAKPPAADV